MKPVRVSTGTQEDFVRYDRRGGTPKRKQEQSGTNYYPSNAGSQLTRDRTRFHLSS
jgi:hypothetical protein